jgi:hypothetical protein
LTSAGVAREFRRLVGGGLCAGGWTRLELSCHRVGTGTRISSHVLVFINQSAVRRKRIQSSGGERERMWEDEKVREGDKLGEKVRGSERGL